MAQKRRNKAVDYTAYLALRMVTLVFHLFPIEWNLRAARRLGDAMWWIIGTDVPLLRKLIKRRHRDQIMENLRRSLGDRYSEGELAAIGKASCEHLVMFCMECFFTPRLVTLGTWRRHVRLKNFEEALRVLLQGRGAVLFTGHYGSWELAGFTLACLGFDTVAVMRPLNNPFINDYLLSIRERRGLKLLYKKGATAGAQEALASGAALGFIADQDAGRKGLFVDFFGRPASTQKSVAHAARSFGVPLIVGCARRISWDEFLYELEVADIIYPEDWAGQEDEIFYITQRFMKAQERMVLADPRQYLWLHRRWKTRPREEREAG
ncbi:MAG: lysophospholipid acyltransferase family protein [Phycisphaerae bacterium]|mgnify:CR=1 FL=1|nr:lysophospholipid acyltransferase family protein [Phycisphaerae bacterium]